MPKVANTTRVDVVPPVEVAIVVKIVAVKDHLYDHN